MTHSQSHGRRPLFPASPPCCGFPIAPRPVAQSIPTPLSLLFSFPTPAFFSFFAFYFSRHIKSGHFCVGSDGPFAIFPSNPTPQSTVYLCTSKSFWHSLLIASSPLLFLPPLQISPLPPSQRLAMVTSGLTGLSHCTTALTTLDRHAQPHPEVNTQSKPEHLLTTIH